MLVDYFGALNYYARVSTTRATGGKTYTYPAATEFQGFIDKSLESKQLLMGGQLGKVIDARLFFDINSTIPSTAIVYDGTTPYRLIGKPLDPSGRGSHYEVLLQNVSSENITLGS